MARANLPMSNDQELLTITSTAILASEHFPCPINKWEALPCASKTWTAWKAHYCAAHLTRRQQMIAVGKSTYGRSANVVTTINSATISPDMFQWLDRYLDNLAVTAMTEHTTLTQLIENIATLTTNQVTSLTASVTSLTVVYTILTAGKHVPHTPNNNNTMDIGIHGYHICIVHDSATSKDKGDGHKNGVNAPTQWEEATTTKVKPFDGLGQR